MAEVEGGQAWQKALDDLAEKVKNAAYVQIGFLPDKTYPDGTLVAMVAAIQEYGAPARNIPPRPFFRQMIAAKSQDWPAQVSELLKQNDWDARVTLDKMGSVVAGDLRTEITTFVGTPLSPVTIARKGFDKQLVDTGTMLDSVEYVVKGEHDSE